MAITNASGTLISQQRYLPFGEVRTDLNGPRIGETDFGYTRQRAVDRLGLVDYRARFYDPTIGRFIQPDSIVPGYANPQALNRFSYVLNNPILLNDPTGHREECGAYVGECEDDQPVPPPDDDEGGGDAGGAGGDGGVSTAGTSEGGTTNGCIVDGDNYSVSCSFQTAALAGYVPGTSQQWAAAASFIDEAALLYDAVLGVYVIAWVVVGLTGGLTFEGNPVTGVAGAAAGYIIGEGSISKTPALFLSNLASSAATAATALSDAKSGNNITGQLNVSTGSASLSLTGQISSGTLLSGGLTVLGWGGPQIVTWSLPVQAAAVANDRGMFGSSTVPIDINASFP